MNAKGVISFILGIIGCIIAFLITTGPLQDTFYKISIGLGIAGVVEFCVPLYDNRKRILFFIQTNGFKRNKKIRITTAYLFRIEINGKYLLIKRHKKDQPGYQPVGGTYKYLKGENQVLFDKLGLEPCNFVPRDEDTENDLRLVMQQRKHLLSYIKWFERRENRELDPWREFYEELVEPGYIPFDIFTHIQYAFIRKTEELVCPSPVFPIDEFRSADIYELKFENDAQKNAIVKLIDASDEIFFATPQEIRRGSTNGGFRILPHTYKILP